MKKQQLPLNELFFAFLGLVFLAAYAAPIINEDLSTATNDLLIKIQVAIWIAFVFEFTYRLFISKSKLNFLKSNFVDLVAIVVPFLRPLRALRVISTAILIVRRFGGGVRYKISFQVGIVALFIWFISGLAVTQAERDVAGSNIDSVREGWWWALTTMTTVGYGDHFPISLEGMVVGAALMLTGVSLLGTVSASIASWFVEKSNAIQEAVETELERNDDKLDSLINEVAMLRREISEIKKIN